MLPFLFFRKGNSLSILIVVTLSLFRATASLKAPESKRADVAKRQVETLQIPFQRGEIPLIPPHRDKPPVVPNLPSVFLDAIDTMQSRYFQLWQGSWPDAIDWTSAVMGTHVSAALSTISRSLDYLVPSTGTSSLGIEYQVHENLLNRYFSQMTAFYFGENAFSLRNQAYDDMLWVVLGWLENIKFIMMHSEMHYTSSKMGNSSAWYAVQFIPSFAHRARIFYELASKGWDTSLCDGGMIWNPSLSPYKNAITNELYIAASISMYLYFPGDDNTSPFTVPRKSSFSHANPGDAIYLKNAVEGYKWLLSSNMTNRHGLYVDGFHISGWSKDSRGTGRCDIRNEMVYTYNQGVLLSGLRGLFIATAARSYLEDGHALIQNVINATDWDTKAQKSRHSNYNDSAPWTGLGRSGILEEACDSSGRCSQDGQTFKGIFFHHLTTFCRPLEPSQNIDLSRTSIEMQHQIFHEANSFHQDTCKKYTRWVEHNAQAAYMTRDNEGLFGMWWGQKFRNNESSTTTPDSRSEPRRSPFDGRIQDMATSAAVDYRNLDISPPSNRHADAMWYNLNHNDYTSRLNFFHDAAVAHGHQTAYKPKGKWSGKERDVNDRGRGRTVETQGSVLAVLRACWELSAL
ncbi:MAG: hypothetical protein M1834_005661 [Cirrosporium novae-zelandiae]|nr:MAG: hypothetical protein M1834_005661 [Cirrosporium novae-zelandiae]